MIEHTITPTVEQMVSLCKRLTDAVEQLRKERDELKDILAGEETRHKRAYEQLNALAKIVSEQDEELFKLRHRK